MWCSPKFMGRQFHLGAVIDLSGCRVLASRVLVSMDTEFCTGAVEEAKLTPAGCSIGFSREL